MINFYRIPEDERNGFGFWIHVFQSEDFYFCYSDNKEQHNAKRKLRLRIHMKLIIWFLSIDIPLKYVGNTYYGRKMK